MWEKRWMLLMKDYSATLINNLWGIHHRAHLPHHFTWGFEAVAPQSCFFFFFKSFLVFDTTNWFSCPQSQKLFFHLFLSHLASRPRISTLTIWVWMLTCAPTRAWNLHKCTNPGRMVKLSQCPGCPDKQHMGVGGAVLCADNRAGLHYLQCTVHW